MKCLKYVLLIVIANLLLVSCNKINDERIPICPVYINLGTTAYWVTYGVHSYGEHRSFILETKTPSNFPFTATTYAGFGGILLVSGYNFEVQDYSLPIAYDLACPVERSNSVRVSVDSKTSEAVCPKCGSHYNILEGGGSPISGQALSYKYGLKRYHVTASSTGGYTITR